ncbi:MAG: lipopolysaccharide biosynthesis protein [Bacteroidales bacterium]|nr:lipopolysaccharide biosynthesis protein [Bacteroidales bacterium]
MSDTTLKEKTSRGLFWGGFSNLLQQLLSVAFGIYLARVLSPDDYGLVGMLTIFIMLSYALQDGGFISALINRNGVSHNDYNAVFWFSTIVSLCFYLILFACAPLIARFFHRPELVALSRWTFLGIIVCGLGIAHRAMLMKKMMIREIAIVNILSIAVSGFVGVFLAHKGFAYWALAIQGVLAATITNAGYWIASHWRPTFHFDTSPLKEMFPYGFRLMVTNILNNINPSLVTVILGRFYNVAQVGFYTQASKWQTMSNNVLSGMVNGIAQPVLFEVSGESDRQLRILRKMVRFIAFATFPAMAGLAFIAPEFIVTFLTSKWSESILLLQILCIGGMTTPISNVLINLILSKGRASQYMYSSLIYFTLTLALAYFLHPHGVVWMVAGVTALTVLWLLVWLLLVQKEVRYSLKHFLLDIAPFFCVTGISIIAAFFITRGISSLALRLVAKVFVTALIYILIMWSSGSVIFKECVRFVKNKLNR